MTSELPRNVQLQFLRPDELQAAAGACPVVYVPFGPIEWHGRHLPLGTDALKAHAIAVKAAEQFGGVVYPPVYFHDGFALDHLQPLLSELFDRLRNTGFRVIIGISGHNVPGMIEMIDRGLAPVLAGEPPRDLTGDNCYQAARPNSVTGAGMWEMSLSRGDESNSDHAAKWETSDMMFFYPACVDLAALGDDEMILDMRAPWGIGGQDPRVHASAEVGRRKAELCAAAIGRRAQELLASLPPAEQQFEQQISPEAWWMI